MTGLFVILAAIIGAMIFKSNLITDTGLLLPGLRSEFFERYNRGSTLYTRLATRITSTKDRETYRDLGNLPQMREWGNGRVIHGLRADGYDVENQKFELSIGVDRDEIDDDQTGQIRMRVQEIGQVAGSHKDKLLGLLIENGGASGAEGYDGVTFFNDAHISGQSGSQDNELTFAAATGTAPTAQEFLDSFMQAKTAMMRFVDDQGEPLDLPDGSLLALVPPEMEGSARTALQAAIIGQTSNIFTGMAEVLPWARLTTTTRWILLRLGVGAMGPFIFQDRAPLEFGALEQNSEQGFLREKYVYGVRARYAFAYGRWYHAVRTTFT